MPARGFWSRSTLALGFALYAWSMMGIELYIAHAPVPEGPDRGLAFFRRLVMGRAVVGVGAAALLAGTILAISGLVKGRQRAAAGAALALAVGWAICLASLWPI